MMKLPKIRLPSGRKTEEIIQEAAIVGGFLMFGHGLYQIYPPLMWIICGICLIIVGYPRKEGG